MYSRMYIYIQSAHTTQKVYESLSILEYIHYYYSSHARTNRNPNNDMHIRHHTLGAQPSTIYTMNSSGYIKCIHIHMYRS